MKPLLLLSNDDGIASPHLRALEDALDRIDLDAERLVVAPERQRSAASHAITLHKPLRLRAAGESRFSLSGTPVDCVYVGIHRVASRRPALVLSGINHGYNLGADVFYSGTVAAAVEGGLRGIPALAMSLSPRSSSDLEAAADFCAALVARVLQAPPPAGTVLNVNLPQQTGAAFAWTRLGERVYQDDVQERLDPRGQPYYWIGGGIAEIDHGADTDCDAVARGVVSITPLSQQRTHLGLLEQGPDWTIEGYDNTTQATAATK